jgi:hypothetical protein
LFYLRIIFTGIPLTLTFCSYLNDGKPILGALEVCESGADYTCESWAIYTGGDSGFKQCKSVEVCDRYSDPSFSIDCTNLATEADFPYSNCTLTCAGYDNLNSADGSDGMASCAVPQANSDTCTGLNSYNTTYNEASVSPFYGLMFSMRAKSDPIEILSMELDISVATVWDEFAVDIYTVLGDFEVAATDSSYWTLVASTVLIPNPSGTAAIVPARNWPAVSMEANELRSFYISLKGPWLDYSPSLGGSTDNVAFTTPDFDVYTGAGVRQFSFPYTGLDPTAIGNLAGTVFYANKNACSREGFVTTVIDYEWSLNVASDSSIEQSFYDGINMIIVANLASNGVLGGFRRAYSLRKNLITTTSQQVSICPDNTQQACQGISGSVTLEYAASLDSGIVEYYFYALNEAITEQIKNLRSGINIRYIGLKGIAADVEISLNGVASGDRMDEKQVDFLADTTQDYLDRVTSETTVLAVQIDNQQLAGRRFFRGRRMQEGTDNLVAIGKILAKQPSQIGSDQFVDALNKGLNTDRLGYMADVKYNTLKPSPISQGNQMGFVIFNDLVELYGEAVLASPVSFDEPVAAPTTPPDDTEEDGVLKSIQDVDTSIWIYVGVALVSLIVLAILIAFCCLAMKNRKSSAEKKYDSEADRSEGSESVDRAIRNSTKEQPAPKAPASAPIVMRQAEPPQKKPLPPRNGGGLSASADPKERSALPKGPSGEDVIVKAPPSKKPAPPRRGGGGLPASDDPKQRSALPAAPTGEDLMKEEPPRRGKREGGGIV